MPDTDYRYRSIEDSVFSQTGAASGGGGYQAQYNQNNYY